MASLKERCDAIEECYEFMLAYAAQGLPGDQGSQSGGQLRHLLARAVGALSGLVEECAAAVSNGNYEPAARYEAFLAVMARDAADSCATLELVLAQPSLSSQLIDSLNASIHLRALLTDLFLIDEILKAQSLIVANPDSGSSQAE
jgi:hypothetical protein